MTAVFKIYVVVAPIYQAMLTQQAQSHSCFSVVDGIELPRH